jgi:hypothetical protein
MVAHFSLCFWKSSHMRSLAELVRVDLPMKPTMSTRTTSDPSEPLPPFD